MSNSRRRRQLPGVHRFLKVSRNSVLNFCLELRIHLNKPGYRDMASHMHTRPYSLSDAWTPSCLSSTLFVRW
jgi:hypothetical protein